MKVLKGYAMLVDRMLDPEITSGGPGGSTHYLCILGIILQVDPKD